MALTKGARTEVSAIAFQWNCFILTLLGGTIAGFRLGLGGPPNDPRPVSRAE